MIQSSKFLYSTQNSNSHSLTPSLSSSSNLKLFSATAICAWFSESLSDLNISTTTSQFQQQISSEEREFQGKKLINFTFPTWIWWTRARGENLDGEWSSSLPWRSDPWRNGDAKGKDPTVQTPASRTRHQRIPANRIFCRRENRTESRESKNHGKWMNRVFGGGVVWFIIPGSGGSELEESVIEASVWIHGRGGSGIPGIFRGKLSWEVGIPLPWIVYSFWVDLVERERERMTSATAA